MRIISVKMTDTTNISTSKVLVGQHKAWFYGSLSTVKKLSIVDHELKSIIRMHLNEHRGQLERHSRELTPSRCRDWVCRQVEHKVYRESGSDQGIVTVLFVSL